MLLRLSIGEIRLARQSTTKPLVSLSLALRCVASEHNCDLLTLALARGSIPWHWSRRTLALGARPGSDRWWQLLACVSYHMPAAITAATPTTRAGRPGRADDGGEYDPLRERAAIGPPSLLNRNHVA